MGSTFSTYNTGYTNTYYDDVDCDMRLASRDVCDEQTWQNTISNRSTQTVQQKLRQLQRYQTYNNNNNTDTVISITNKRSRRLSFASYNSVHIFDTQSYINDDYNESSDDDEYEQINLKQDIEHEENLKQDNISDSDSTFKFADLAMGLLGFSASFAAATKQFHMLAGSDVMVELDTW